MAEEQKLALTLRPDSGNSGKKFSVLTNLYEVSLKDVRVYLYAMILDNDDISKKLRSRLFPLLQEQYDEVFAKPSLASDEEKMIYSGEDLGFKERKFDLTLGKQILSINVRLVGASSIKDVGDFASGKLEITPRDGIQVIEVALAQYPKATMTSAGRGYFDGKSSFDIADGAQVWFGYRQSIKIGQGKVYLNVDMAVSAFIAPTSLLDFISQCEGRPVEELIKRNKGSLPPDTVKRVNRKLKGLNVEVVHMGNKRKYKCNGISGQSALEYKFTTEDNGKEVSVSEYFYNRFNISLGYPELPLVHVGPLKKNIMLPIELCSISKGQRLNKLTPKQTADVIKAAAKRPMDRLKFIQGSTSVMRDPGADPAIRRFGVSVGANIAQVEARILDPPEIVYKQEGRSPKVVARGGQWRADQEKFLKTSAISRWGIVSFEKDRYLQEREIQDIVSCFVKFGAEVGLFFEEKKPPICFGDSRNTRCIQDSIKDIMQTCQDTFSDAPQILFFFLPGNATSALYGEIKRTCETIVDVPSQCMQVSKVKKKQAAYIKNVLLKVNVKAGGTNWILQKNQPWTFFMNKPAIIIGADVTHAGAGSRMPSVAAVVGSMDSNCSRYGAVYRTQGHRVEVIAELQDMVRGLLLKFYKSTGGKKPEKILFYRDGVSEGQFQAVLEHEVAAVRKACGSLEKDYCPPITFVVVQKRHHVRFFPASPRDADKSGNVPAGTVVDSNITHPSQFDFYLASHAGLQGTSKPCHYHVLYDENGFNSNAMQEFTYNLCYTYARCTKSVSLVPPVYYAHLGAFRAKYHVSGDLYSDDTSSVTSDGNSENMNAMVLNPVKPKTDSVMYFI